MKNCLECSHGEEIPEERKGNKRYRFYCLKHHKKTELFTAFDCPDYDGKGLFRG